MEVAVQWAPPLLIFVGSMTIVCTILHLIQSTLRPPQCCSTTSGTIIIGLPRVYPHSVFKYSMLESQKCELDQWHQTPYPIFDV